MVKKVKVALVYDFDGTLSTTNMQDYGLIQLFKMRPKTFWRQANQWWVDNYADQITSSMYYFVKMSNQKKVPLSREVFADCAKNIEYYAGVENWFDRINHYGDMLDLDIEHYIISSGYEEIIEGSSIRKYFKEVFGCAYAYDDKGHPIWPARVVNYSTKTQYLSKINKGLGKLEDRAVNEFMPDEDRPIPFSRMIYLGDGDTDIPSMRLVKKSGGKSIAVYRPKSHKHKTKAIKLLTDGRVDFALPADYSEDSQIDTAVKTILVKLATERDLQVLQEKENKKKLPRDKK
ncbi:MAG: haloacid dehalogenase-like hydrolase [Alphaproteobacteria bacterium]|nr:haloacid dehalogenase-like hydrolase [Alphaproteobacteria bacterium]